MSIARLDIYDTMRLGVVLTRETIFSKIEEIAEYEQVLCIEDKKVYIKIGGELYSSSLVKEEL